MFWGMFAYGIFLFFLSTTKLDALRENPHRKLIAGALLLPFLMALSPFLAQLENGDLGEIKSSAATGILIGAIGFSFLLYRLFEARTVPGEKVQNIKLLFLTGSGIFLITLAFAAVAAGFEQGSKVTPEFKQAFTDFLIYSFGGIVLAVWMTKGWFWGILKAVVVGILRGAGQATAEILEDAENESSSSKSSRNQRPVRSRQSPASSAKSRFSGTAPSIKSSSRSASKPASKTSGTTFGKGHKLCATCAKWGGDRTLHPGRNHVIASSGMKGQCMGGGHNRAQVGATARCNEYEKWSALA